jgi:hypothetical protein
MPGDFDTSAARALVHALSRRPQADLARRFHDLAYDLTRIREDAAPTPVELAAAPRLENWKIALDLGGPVLIGKVMGHPILGGRTIFISPVWAVDPNALAWARTLSRWYALGPPANARPAGTCSGPH